MNKKKVVTAAQHARFPLSLGVVFYSVLLGALVAIIAGCYEQGFFFIADVLHSREGFFSTVPSWVFYVCGPFIAVPIILGLLSFIPERRPHTISDLISDIHLNGGAINALAALCSSLAALFSMAFGFSVGYYAPMVQIGAGLGALAKRVTLTSSNHIYVSVGAGAAAAIAAIFHSPIGAVVFVHEVLFRFFSIRAFAPVTIAAVTAYVVSRELFDKLFFFDVLPDYYAGSHVYVIAAGAGVLSAIVGVLLLRSIAQWQKLSARFHISTRNQLLLAACVTACVTLLVPQALGNDVVTLPEILRGGSFSIAFLGVIIIAKFFLTATAFGAGIPGGIFGPSIFIGAALGGIIAQAMTLIYPDMASAQQILIITTMAALLSAILGAPSAMILIVVEMTGEFHIISVVMLAVVMANLTAYRLMGTSSIFDAQLKSRGLDIDAGRERMNAEHISIKDIISDDYLALETSVSLSDAERQMLDAEKSQAFVLDGEGNLRGTISLVKVERYCRKGASETTLDIVMDTDIAPLYATSSIWTSLQAMNASHGNCLPVIDGHHNPKLLGVVYDKPLMSRYFSCLNALRREQNLT